MKSPKPNALFDQAFALWRAGRLEEALAKFERFAKLMPNLSSVHAHRGLLLKQLNRLDEALISVEKAISLQPDYADAWNIHGAVLWDMKRLDEALVSVERVIALDAGASQAWSNRCALLHSMKRWDEALASVEKAIKLQPNHAEAWNNRGAVLRDMKRLVEALASVDKALSLQPGYAAAWNNRGLVLQHRRRLTEALASFDRAVALKPDYADAWFNRGNMLSELKRPDEALASYGKAFATNPRAGGLFSDYLLAKLAVCDWTGLQDYMNTCAAAIREGKLVILPFLTLSLLDDPALQKLAAEAYSAALSSLSTIPDPFPERKTGDRIRIAYYSGDFHRHATAYLMAELLESHDCGKFELFGFSFGPDLQDDMRQRVSATFDRFADVRDMSDQDVARLSRECGIDIAIDLKGYTQNARPGIFAGRCAPIQLQYLGYPGTMGSSNIDYLVADHTVIPHGSEGDYSEKIIWLPHSYQANDSQRKISSKAFARKDVGLPASGFVFCCFNNSYKILPETFECWMRILKAVDGSVLWLLEDNAEAAKNLRAEAAAKGIDAGRLIFAERLPVDEHLARQRLADLFLDTWPCNAHTTASDALWAGLPVLTCTGRTFASRVAASLLKAVGLPDLITGSKKDYEALAIALASNPAQLAHIRTRLEDNRCSAPLFDGRLTARALEASYLAIHARYQSGSSADHIEINF